MISRFGYIGDGIIAPPLRRESDDVLVIEEVAFYVTATTKCHPFPGVEAAQLVNRLYIQNGLSHPPQTFTIRLSASRTTV